MRTLARCVACLVLSLSLPMLAPTVGKSAGAGETAQERADAVYDCGTLALFFLAQVEHHPIELRALESRLPTPRSRGYSMKELRDAAWNCGFALTGVRLRIAG